MATNTENRRVNIYINGQEVENTFKSIRAEYYKTNAQLNKMNRSHKDYNKTASKLRELKGHMEEHRRKVNGMSRAWSNMKQMALAVVGGNLITGAMQTLGRLWQTAFRGVKELSDQMATVQKVTKMTDAEVKDLTKTFQGMNTRTSRMELLGIAETLGRMGRPKGEIAQATIAMDKLQVALGDEFGTGAKETADTVGRLRNVLLDVKSDDFATDMLNLGNAINTMTNEGMASAPVVADFTNRIGSLGIPLGLTSGQTIGLSAALQELNVAAERGGTAVGKILVAMANKPDLFSSVAGMDPAEFKSMVDQDLFGAFLKVAEGASKGGQTATSFAAILNELGLEGVRTSEVLAKVSGNTEFVREKADLATKALKSQNTIMSEYNRMNTTAAAVVEKVGRKLYGTFLNGKVFGAIESLIISTGELLGVVKPLSQEMAEEQKQLQLVGLRLTETNLPTEERIKLIDQLKRQYPEYLGNLDSETATNQELKTAIKAVNDQLINKIILQKQDEEIEEQNNSIAEKKMQLIEYENKLREKLLSLAKRHNLTIKEEGDLIDKANDLRNQVDGLTNERGQRYGESAKALQIEINGVVDRMQELKTLENEGNALLNERQALEKRLGIGEDAQSTNTTGGNSDVPTSPTTPTSGEKIGILKRINAEIQAETERMNEAMTSEEVRAHQERIAGLQRWKNAVLGEYEDMAIPLIDTLREATDRAEAHLKEVNAAAKEDMQDRSDAYQESLEKEQALAHEAAQKARALRDIDQALFTEDLSYRIEQETLYWDEKIELAEMYGYKEEELERMKQERLFQIKAEHLARQTQKVQEFWNAADQFSNIYNQSQNARDDQRASALNAKHGYELSVYDNMLKKKTISESTYAARKLELEENYKEKERDIKRQQFQRQKAADIIKSTINTALAVTRALATGGIAASFAAAGLGAAQTALIASKPVPKFAKGSGVVTGPSHSNGGIDMINSQTGQKVGEMEGGEMYHIYSKDTVANNRSVMDALLNSSMNGGGRAISMSEIAGDKFGLNHSIANRSSTPMFEDGGAVSTTELASAGGDNSEFMQAFLNEFRQQRQQPVKAFVVHDDISNANRERELIESLNEA